MTGNTFAVDIPKQRSYCGLGNALQRVIRWKADPEELEDSCVTIQEELEDPL
jgi:hypothetical protein